MRFGDTGTEKTEIRRPGEDRSRNSSNAATSQGIPGFASNHQKLGRGKEGSFRGCVTGDTLILDFGSPEQ